MKLLLTIIGWILSSVMVLTVGCVMLAVGGFLIATPIGWLMLAPVLAVVASYRYFTRRQRAATALNYIEQGMTADLPMTQILATLGTDHRNTKTRAAAIKGSAALAQGYPIGHVIAIGVDGLNSRERSLMQSTNKTGRVLPTLQHIVAGHRRQRDYQFASMIAGFAYPLAFLVIAAALVALLSIILIPKFEAIFDDFDIALPLATQYLLRISRMMRTDTLQLGLLVVGFVALTIVASVTMAAALRGRLGVIAWWLPGWRRLERSRGLADACFIMAQSVEAGATMPHAVRNAATIGVNPFLRSKLRRWARLVEDGGDTIEAAKQVGLPQLMTGMIATGQASGELVATLRLLQRHYESQFSRIVFAARSLIAPCMTLLIAPVVGFIVFALFTPMPALIMTLIPTGALP